MPRYGYNGNPWKGGNISGTLILNELSSIDIRHGIQRGWYADAELGRKNLTHRITRLTGEIRFNEIALVRDENFQKFYEFWLAGTKCEFSLENYLKEKNTFKPKRMHPPSIGICARYGEMGEIFRIDKNNGFWGSIMLNDFLYDEIQQFIKNKWILSEEYSMVSNSSSCNIVFEFHGYACYGARVFGAENPDYNLNAIAIRSLSEITRFRKMTEYDGMRF